MEPIALRKTPWQRLSDNMYFIIGDASKLPFAAQDHQSASAVAAIGLPSVCQMSSGSSFKVTLHTPQAVSLGFCLMPLHPIDNINNAPKYTYRKLKSHTIHGCLENGSHQTFVHSNQLDLCSETSISNSSRLPSCGPGWNWNHGPSTFLGLPRN